MALREEAATTLRRASGSHASSLDSPKKRARTLQSCLSTRRACQKRDLIAGQHPRHMLQISTHTQPRTPRSQRTNDSTRCAAKPRICSSCFDVQHAPSHFSMRHVGAGWRDHEARRCAKKKQSPKQQARARTRWHKRTNTPSTRTGRQPATANNAQERQQTTKTDPELWKPFLRNWRQQRWAQQWKNRLMADVTEKAHASGHQMDGGCPECWFRGRAAGGSHQDFQEKKLLFLQLWSGTREVASSVAKFVGPRRTGERYSTQDAQHVLVPEEDAEAPLPANQKEWRGDVRVRAGPCKCRNGVGRAAGDRRRNGMRNRHDPRSWCLLGTFWEGVRCSAAGSLQAAAVVDPLRSGA